jgi:low temperature requirement protein LtrA
MHAARLRLTVNWYSVSDLALRFILIVFMFRVYWSAANDQH